MPGVAAVDNHLIIGASGNGDGKVARPCATRGQAIPASCTTELMATRWHTTAATTSVCHTSW